MASFNINVSKFGKFVANCTGNAFPSRFPVKSNSLKLSEATPSGGGNVAPVIPIAATSNACIFGLLKYCASNCKNVVPISNIRKFSKYGVTPLNVVSATYNSRNDVNKFNSAGNGSNKLFPDNVSTRKFSNADISDGTFPIIRQSRKFRLVNDGTPFHIDGKLEPNVFKLKSKLTNELIFNNDVGMSPLKKLADILNSAKFVKPPKISGNAPEKLFSAALNNRKFVKSPICIGKSPKKLFSLTNSISMLDGNVEIPLNRFASSIKDVNCVSDDNVVGNCPSSKLSFNNRLSKLGNDVPISGGIGPVSWLEKRLRLRRAVAVPSSVGIIPTRKLDCKSSASSCASWPSCGGMLPVKLLPAKSMKVKPRNPRISEGIEPIISFSFNAMIVTKFGCVASPQIMLSQLLQIGADVVH
mmetsp:Transcript_14720/g.41678  ORF Transcript_14720/g.41678 Transcript_14720/m.41678 type:complete len:413 (+) Transcript_14720:450-1688(+)